MLKYNNLFRLLIVVHLFEDLLSFLLSQRFRIRNACNFKLN